MTTTTKKKPAMEKAKKARTWKMGRSYTGVSEMVRDMADAETANSFEKHMADCQLASCLTVLRCAKDISQAELAARMGCGQSKVSKMESSLDADLNFGDIVKYATSLKSSLHIVFTPGRSNGADHIRFHLASVKRELDRLVKVAGDDKEICDGVETFAIETMQKMVAMIEEAIDRLPHRSQSKVPVSVEAEGDRGEPIPLNTPKRVRRNRPSAAKA